MVKRIILAAICLLPVSGCSLVFVQAPPEFAAGQPAPGSVTCTDSLILPILDFVGSVGFVAYGVSALWLGEVAEGFEDAFDMTDEVSDEIDFLGYSLLAAGGTLGYSGIKGRQKVNSCKDVRAAASDAGLHFATSLRAEREPAYMQKSVWHEVLDQYRSPQNDLLLPIIQR